MQCVCSACESLSLYLASLPTVLTTLENPKCAHGHVTLPHLGNRWNTRCCHDIHSPRIIPGECDHKHSKTEESWVKPVTNKSKVDAVCDRKNVTEIVYNVWKVYEPCLQQYLERWQTITIWSGAVVPYCPEQALMGARNSSAKIWGWVVTPDAKLAAMGPNLLASLVRPCLVKASLTVQKAVSCYKADRLIASLLSFRSVQSSPAVRKFCGAREECCEPSHGQVCANLMSWRPKRIRAMWAQRTYLRIHYARISVMGGYTENLEKPQNCQKWGVGACSGQYGTCILQVNAHTL